MRWFQRLLYRKNLEKQLASELRFHLDEQVKDYLAAGMTEQEARRQAQSGFGGAEQIKEECRDARGTRWLEDVAQDLRFAFRMMVKNRSFTFVAVTSLALGIGANTAVFSLIDAVLLKMLPVDHPEQLFILNRSAIDSESSAFSYPAFERLRGVLHSPADLGAMSTVAAFNAVVAPDQPEAVRGQLVSGEWFDLLGIRPILGRSLMPADDRLGAPGVAILSHGFWQRRFAANPSVLHRTITVNGTRAVIVGVAPSRFFGFSVGEAPDLWLPLAMQHDVRYSQNASIDNADGRKPWGPQQGIQWLTLIGRLRSANLIPATVQKFNVVFRHDLEQRAAQMRDKTQRELMLRQKIGLQPGGKGLSELRRSVQEPLWVLMATVAVVLLIACANLANLLLARGAARRREVAIRLSIGAGRGRLVRQLLTESALLALVGGALSLMVGRLGSRLLLRLASNGPEFLPLQLPLDNRVLAFTTVVSLTTGLLFGLAPALRITRVELAGALKANARVLSNPSEGGGSRFAFSKGLVAIQVAFSLMLLIAAVLFARTLQNLTSVDPGFEQNQVLTARIDLRAAGYTEKDLPALYVRLMDRVRSVPGVRFASLSLTSLATSAARISDIYVAGRSSGSSSQENHVAGDYFATVGIPIIRGRDFGPHDTEASPKVAIVNEAFARRFFGKEDPVGRRFGYDPSDSQFEIIGVARDTKVSDLRKASPAMIFYSLRQNPTEFIRTVNARVEGDPAAVAAGIRSALAQMDRNLPVRDVLTLAQRLDRTLTQEKLVARLTGFFSLLAVALSCLGLFGVMSYKVARRTGEIGIRLALGSSQTGILWLVLRETLLLVAAGVVAGLVLTLASVRLVKALLYGLSPSDPVTLAAATTLLVAVAALAGYIPAWRASRLDPMTALRYE